MRFSTFCLSCVVPLIFLEANLIRYENVPCSANDLEALNEFFKRLDVANGGWKNQVSDCCTWSGVTCDNSSSVHRKVVALELGNKRLSGEICGSLASLDELRVLDLSRNSFTGPLPIELFHMDNLEVLDLSDNNLRGSIPIDINLPMIWYLDISGNNLAGPLHTNLCETSPSIKVLSLQDNYFNAGIQNLGNCTSLQHLFLDRNEFSGSLPESTFRLHNLRELHLQGNQFSGPLDERIGKLHYLVRLDISQNAFSGQLPDIFGSLSRLEYFSANMNAFSATVPESLMSLPSLLKLDLGFNFLSGSISINCSAMSRLTYLNLGSNLFHGQIPENLSTCHNLSTINISRNKVAGEIPTSFKNLRALTILTLSNTSISNISSALATLQHCKNLSVLVFTMSFRNEDMPVDLTLRFEGLKQLVIANSQLRGSLPNWLSNCKNIQLLDLSWNHLIGSIPTWFGNFKFLFYIDLSNNSFSGEIPKSTTELPTLAGVISSIEPYPIIPLYSKRLKYKNILNFRPTLALSYNQLSGPIWPGFGTLTKLHVFDLKENLLSGLIPDRLSEMTNLEILDFSLNNLSGGIPQSLARLNFLSKFNVSYNQLDGKIPSQGQFMTFPTSSFEGNNGLCGEQFLPCSCGMNPSIAAEPDPSEGSWINLELPFRLGIAFGFIVVVACTFLPFNPCRGWKRENCRRTVVINLM